MRRISLFGSLIAFVAIASGADFAADIEPIFRENCYVCHGEQQQLGQLRLDSRRVATSPGPSGSRLVPHDAAASSLYRRVAGVGDGNRMPMGGQLSDAEVALIKTWIEAGGGLAGGQGLRGRAEPALGVRSAH